MKTVVLHSGGLDSTVLLYKLLRQQDEVVAVAFDYGQRHAKELALGEELCRLLMVEREVVKLPFLETVPSSQTRGTRITVDTSRADAEARRADRRSRDAIVQGDREPFAGAIEVPEGHYAAANMKLTVVPNRNMIMIACATSLGLARQFNRVCFAAHAGDHDIYPDCREDFISFLRGAVQHCDWSVFTLHAPLIKYTKAQIVSLGHELGVPFEKTWSCYKGGEKACGRCGTCVERLEAFAKARREDPLEYEDRGFWITATEVIL